MPSLSLNIVTKPDQVARARQQTKPMMLGDPRPRGRRRRRAAAAAARVLPVALNLLLLLSSPSARAAAPIMCEPFAAVANQAAFELYCWDIS